MYSDALLKHDTREHDPRRTWRLPGVPPRFRCSAQLVGLAIVAAAAADVRAPASSPPIIIPPAAKPSGSAAVPAPPPATSIFTLSSPPRRSPRPLQRRSPASCSLCRRPLLTTKDIYMYRDAQAFCTKQCRQHQMIIDDRKEKTSSTISKAIHARSKLALRY